MCIHVIIIIAHYKVVRQADERHVVAPLPPLLML